MTHGTGKKGRKEEGEKKKEFYEVIVVLVKLELDIDIVYIDNRTPSQCNSASYLLYTTPSCMSRYVGMLCPIAKKKKNIK